MIDKARKNVLYTHSMRWIKEKKKRYSCMGIKLSNSLNRVKKPHTQRSLFWIQWKWKKKVHVCKVSYRCLYIEQWLFCSLSLYLLHLFTLNRFQKEFFCTSKIHSTSWHCTTICWWYCANDVIIVIIVKNLKHFLCWFYISSELNTWKYWNRRCAFQRERVFFSFFFLKDRKPYLIHRHTHTHIITNYLDSFNTIN